MALEIDDFCPASADRKMSGATRGHLEDDERFVDKARAGGFKGGL